MAQVRLPWHRLPACDGCLVLRPSRHCRNGFSLVAEDAAQFRWHDRTDALAAAEETVPDLRDQIVGNVPDRSGHEINRPANESPHTAEPTKYVNHRRRTREE